MDFFGTETIVLFSVLCICSTSVYVIKKVNDWIKSYTESESYHIKIINYHPIPREIIGIIIHSMNSQLADELIANKQSPLHISETIIEDDEKLVPDEYKCPIGREIMKDPVVAFDGYTYDYDNIARHLENNNTSPMTNARLSSKLLFPNRNLRTSIEKFISIHLPNLIY